MDNNKDIDFDDDFKDFGEEQDFVAPNIDELGKNIKEKEEEILVPNFEDDTQSLEETEESNRQNENSEKLVAQLSELSKEKSSKEELSESSEEPDSKENVADDNKIQQEKTPEEIEKELEEEKKKELRRKFEENSEKLEQWEELDSNNDIVKKYIIYVNKENIKAIDKLSIDERNAFMNSAIKLKFENIDAEKAKTKKKILALHTAIMIATAILFMPFAVYLAHISIVATFKNYKYSQDNFEKLYKESFSKSPTYQKAQKYIKH